MTYGVQQLTTLKAFLDIEAATYSGLNDQDAAVTLNTASVVRVRESMAGEEIFEATDAPEFDALTEAQKAQWLSLCSISSMNPANGATMVTIAQDIFGGASATSANIQAARDETVTPAQSIGLPLARADYVRRARLLP